MNEIDLKNITKRFGSQSVLDSVSFSIEPGRVIGLLGENGAGKTTLLRILGGTLEPDSGTILFNGVPTTSQLRRRQTAVLHGGNAGLYEDLTVRDNIAYFAKLRGLSDSEQRKAIRYLADRFKITDYLDKKAGKLSTGMRQKTAIVRALIHNPSIILFDEPDSGLDFSAAEAVDSFLFDCANEGKTVVISSHSAGDVLALCESIILLHQGILGSCYSISELTDGKSFKEAYASLHRMVG
ncbi:MAG: ATP-binding cassette domain-containing protein [Eggerthellaceae bacterium]|nr:ATP-binding cassette domain-containing protein [Eggerthellaceae bacterium]